MHAVIEPINLRRLLIGIATTAQPILESVNSVAFQFLVDSVGKSFLSGTSNGFVQHTLNKLTCVLSVSTYSSAVSSNQVWYTKSIELDIDGGTNSPFRKWESFKIGRASCRERV